MRRSCGGEARRLLTEVSLSFGYNDRFQLFAPGKLLYIYHDDTAESGVKSEWIDAK